jgi:hypothetical protein
MTPENFLYWLQGYAELSTAPPTKEQWKVIQDHIALALVKKTSPLPLSPIVAGLHPGLGKYGKYNQPIC